MAPGLADKGESKTRRRTKMISAILAALKTAILELVPPSTGWVRGSECWTSDLHKMGREGP